MITKMLKPIFMQLMHTTVVVITSVVPRSDSEALMRFHNEKLTKYTR